MVLAKKKKKPPLVVANVAQRAGETLCTSCHSFPLSEWECQRRYQSVGAHAEVVMCHHAGMNRDRQRWIAHSQNGGENSGKLDEFKFSLHEIL